MDDARTDSDGYPVDDAGKPRVRHPGGKQATLERMLEHRERRLAEDNGGGQLTYYQSEAAALRAAIAVMRYYRADLDGLLTAPIVLQQLVDAMAREDELDADFDATQRVHAAMDAARKLLKELEDP